MQEVSEKMARLNDVNFDTRSPDYKRSTIHGLTPIAQYVVGMCAEYYRIGYQQLGVDLVSRKIPTTQEHLKLLGITP